VDSGSLYKGEDRRQRGDDHGTTSWTPVFGALALVLLLALIVSFGPLFLPVSGRVDSAALDSLLDAAALAIAGLISGLCYVRWRLVGQASSLWLAVAAMTYGTLTVGVGHILPVILTAGAPEVTEWLHPASRIVVIGLLVTALRSPDVDASLTVRRVILVAVGATAVVTVVFQLLPVVGTALSGAEDRVRGLEGGILGSVVLIIVLTCLGVAYFIRGIQLPRQLFPWFGVLLIGLATVELHRVLPLSRGGMWVFGDGFLRFVAMLAAVYGATRELLLTFGEQSGHLLRSVTTGLTAEARIRAEQAAKEERAHEARNALTAIEGATRTLERYRDRLDPDTRESLAQAVSGEIARLQQLVSVEWVRSDQHEFNVARCLRTVIISARAREMDIHVDIDPDVAAFGRAPETAEVVQNLLENARRYAPGSPVLIRAQHDGDHVVLRVEDRGPGVPRTEQRTIFHRGVRGSAVNGNEGSGLGLFVSTQLMREQGGDLWVEERPGGGASFVARLPASQLAAEPEGQDADIEAAAPRSDRDRRGAPSMSRHARRGRADQAGDVDAG
jgi:two-component system, OmpR family, sensor kinase